MNRLFGYIAIAILILMIFIVDVTVLKSIAWVRTAVNPTLLVIIIAVNWSGLKVGLTCALAAGWIGWLNSSLASGTYPLAYLSTGLLIWLLVRRVFATRAHTSYIGLVIIGTIFFYLILGVVAVLGHWQSPLSSPFDWAAWWPLAAAQIISHPVIAWLAWRISGRDRQYTAALADQGRMI